jgi:hypothetical protein
LATTEEITVQLDALRAQRASGVARVSYDGKTVEYRGDNEIVAAIRALESERKQLSGERQIRQIRVTTSKGY